MKTITFNQLKRLIKESRREFERFRQEGLYYAVGYFGYSNDDYDIIDSSKDKNALIKLAKEEYDSGIYDCINVCNPDSSIITTFGNSDSDNNDGWEY